MVSQADIDKLRNKTLEPQNLLIDGALRGAASGETLSIISPIDGTDLAEIASAGQPDVNDAVAAARRSFDDGGWSRAAPRVSSSRCLPTR